MPTIQSRALRVVHERTYPLSTSDFGPVVDEITMADPDLVFICSYLADSIGMVRAINDRGFRPKMVGGAMIGPQNTPVKTALGALLNGFVSYDYWVPVPKMMFPGVREMIDIDQTRAVAAGVDELGHYVAPLAYAQMQVLEQAVIATGSLDDAALSAHARGANFNTVMGDVKFGESGEWAMPRVVQVQFQNVLGNTLEQFRGAEKQVVVAPNEFASGTLIYPYAAAKR